jgi:hypothetical protein
LNLEKNAAGVCNGIAFEFADDRESEIREYLLLRKGKDFPLETLRVRLKDDAEVQAYVPVYHGKNLVHAATAEEKAMTSGATPHQFKIAGYFRRPYASTSPLALK